MKLKSSTLAGKWYPSEPEELRRSVDSLLAAGDGTDFPLPPIDPAWAVIVPHAGYRYSGAVAGVAYRALRDGEYGRIVILAPSHRMAHRGVAMLEVEGFQTPLGIMPVDPAVHALACQEAIAFDPRPFEGEHSLEIQIPFLQRAFPAATLVPLLFGFMGTQEYRQVAHALEGLTDAHTAFVVSSDFTHYGWRFDYQPFPADNPEHVRTALRELDMRAIAPVLAGDADGFMQHVEASGATICGRIPIAAFLGWHGRRSAGRLLAYQTSLDITGDYEHSVSYAAIAFPRPS